MKTPKEMIDEMASAGFRQREISLSTGLAESHISELRTGLYQDVRVSTYNLLSDLHKKVMRRHNRKLKKIAEAV